MTTDKAVLSVTQASCPNCGIPGHLMFHRKAPSSFSLLSSSHNPRHRTQSLIPRTQPHLISSPPPMPLTHILTPISLRPSHDIIRHPHARCAFVLIYIRFDTAWLHSKVRNAPCQLFHVIYCSGRAMSDEDPGSKFAGVDEVWRSVFA